MEILKSEQYISEKLNIKPVSKDRLAELFKEPEVDDKTKQFIKDNNLVWNPLTRLYDTDKSIDVDGRVVKNGMLTINFGKIGGNFYCGNNKLTSLKGAPNEVGGSFYCNHNQLTTLEDAPQKVGRGFYCSYNILTSLKGAPNEVGEKFDCDNNRLTSLEGAPQKVGGNFDCSYNQLTTLEGAPNEVKDDFYCINNPNLVLPKTKPSWIKGDFKK